MAGDWMPIRLDLPEDPDVIRIAALTDMDEDSIVGKLVRVWSWFSKVSRDGHAPGVTDVWLDRYAGVTGMCRAMVEVGWMQVTDHGLTMLNYETWMSGSAKKRLQDKKRQQVKREKDSRKSVTQTSRTQRDKSVTREEGKGKGKKRRDFPSEKTSPSESSPSPSLSERNKHRCHDAAEKLFGREGAGRHAADSPQMASDQTCFRRWVDSGVLHDARVNEFIEWCGLAAKKKGRPMGWLTKRMQERGWL